MSRARKIVVISDSYLLSAGVESLALEIKGLLVDEVFTGKEKKLCDKVFDRKPDFIIIDPISLGERLITFMNEINNEPDITVIGLISSYTEPNIASRFSYVLDRENSKKDLVYSLQNIVGKTDSESDNESVLSKREIEILKELVLGLTNQEVADKLFLSVHTVTTHRKKITKKLGIKTVPGLTVFALINNIIDIREVERRL